MSATEPRYCPISTLHRKPRQGTGSKGRARATVTRRLCTIAGFYRYTVEEELFGHSPAAHVRRRRVDYESHAAALDRNELGALLVAAGPPTDLADLAARAERAAQSSVSSEPAQTTPIRRSDAVAVGRARTPATGG
jgi:integrase